MRLAVAEAALDRRADAGRDRRDRTRRDRTTRECRRCRGRRSQARAPSPRAMPSRSMSFIVKTWTFDARDDLLLDLVEVADADQHRVLRQHGRARRRAKRASSAGSAPSSAASGMPCTLPDSLVAGLFMSPCASTQIRPSGLPLRCAGTPPRPPPIPRRGCDRRRARSASRLRRARRATVWNSRWQTRAMSFT